MLESFVDDDEQAFEYDSLAEVPPPMVAPDLGRRVYALSPALSPALGSTSHCPGALAAADCSLTRFPVLSVDRYEVPHDLARDWIV